MSNPEIITIDTSPRFELSPHLYMQFMEPLGATDGSVEAAWDHQNATWRPDLVSVTRELAPGMVRWGGCFSSYYRWREAVGPREARTPMHNLLWGGIESNQIGTREFVDFCAQVRAEPLLCVNFESDGRAAWANPRVGGHRSAGPDEAAAWVSYCNRADDAPRQSHASEPSPVRFWQIGNETSYDSSGYDLETAAHRTVDFARAMRQADPSLALIGWGDSGWAERMAQVAGEHLDYLAFHHMFHPSPHDPILDGVNYRRDAERTWNALMQAPAMHERKIRSVREQVEGTHLKLAMTECHFTINGRDRGDVMSSWAVGVAYARMLNIHQRHGDVLKIATLSDFCGTRWQVNSVIIPTPSGRSYLLPVGHVMRLFRRHSGQHAVATLQAPDGLDITASRTQDRLFLHVVNTRRDQAISAPIEAAGRKVKGGRCFEIAADPRVEVLQSDPDVLRVEEKAVDGATWTFPAASVSALEIEL